MMKSVFVIDQNSIDDNTWGKLQKFSFDNMSYFDNEEEVLENIKNKQPNLLLINAGIPGMGVSDLLMEIVLLRFPIILYSTDDIGHELIRSLQFEGIRNIYLTSKLDQFDFSAVA